MGECAFPRVPSADCTRMGVPDAQPQYARPDLVPVSSLPPVHGGMADFVPSGERLLRRPLADETSLPLFPVRKPSNSSPRGIPPRVASSDSTACSWRDDRARPRRPSDRFARLRRHFLVPPEVRFSMAGKPLRKKTSHAEPGPRAPRAPIRGFLGPKGVYS